MSTPRDCLAGLTRRHTVRSAGYSEIVITIVYASRASQPMSAIALAQLLQVAHDRNAAHDVTGMLLYAQQSFLQQLEGDAEAVDAIYDSICNDPRHTDIRLFSHREVTDRRFPTWSMGFEHPDVTSLSERLPAYRPPDHAPLISAELIQDTQMAEALLSVYALGLRA
jgi:hypothetical protein